MARLSRALPEDIPLEPTEPVYFHRAAAIQSEEPKTDWPPEAKAHLKELYRQYKLNTLKKKIQWISKYLGQDGSEVCYHGHTRTGELGPNAKVTTATVTDRMKLGMLLYDYLERRGLIKLTLC